MNWLSKRLRLSLLAVLGAPVLIGGTCDTPPPVYTGMCDNAACGVDSPRYVNLVSRDQPINVAVADGEHLDYLGSRFRRGVVHRNYRIPCNVEIAEDSVVAVPLETRQVSWTEEAKSRIGVRLKADIVAIIEAVTSGQLSPSGGEGSADAEETSGGEVVEGDATAESEASEEETPSNETEEAGSQQLVESLRDVSNSSIEARVGLVVERATRSSLGGSASFKRTVYRLRAADIQRLRDSCSDDNLVVEIAVMRMEAGTVNQQLSETLLADLAAEFELTEAASIALRAMLEQTVNRSIRSSFDAQSFLLAAGWAR